MYHDLIVDVAWVAVAIHDVVEIAKAERRGGATAIRAHTANGGNCGTGDVAADADNLRRHVLKDTIGRCRQYVFQRHRRRVAVGDGHDDFVGHFFANREIGARCVIEGRAQNGLVETRANRRDFFRCRQAVVAVVAIVARTCANTFVFRRGVKRQSRRVGD